MFWRFVGVGGGDVGGSAVPIRFEWPSLPVLLSM